ncbi:glycosyltransferase [Desulfovibrio inopinatus]|uniref:glycosyltransferase n=1 Tax=Desulfovibrio inopinatus TaxID=102109 RepID=UPI00040DC66A|nr:glycosyltransferase [Desulfovibrio inopinatus]
MKVSIIIPVYGNIGGTCHLLDSIKRNTSFEYISDIFVSEDCSCESEYEILEEYISRLGAPFISHRNSTNLGFGGNCNQAFEKVRSNCDIVVFANTDTVVPPGWVERLEAIFHDDDVALASPFSNKADAQSVFYSKGADWLEVDELLSRRSPQYPQLSKISGFFLAVRTTHEQLFKPFLFDVEAFGKGYWEDTDLHFRAVELGLKSVLIDNLFIKHAGFISFSSANAEAAIELSEKNRSIFLDKWRGVDLDILKPINVVEALDGVRDRQSRIFKWEARRHLNLLVVVPIGPNTYASGGGTVIFNLLDKLIDYGFTGNILSNHQVDARFFNEKGFMPFEHVSELYRRIDSVDHVWATSCGSVALASTIADHYGCKLTMFAQGPESYFGEASNSTDFLNYIPTIDNVVCVSPYLKKYYDALGIPVDATLDLGPSRHDFYKIPSLTRRAKTIAINIAKAPMKGPSLAMTFCFIALKRGFEVILFGSGSGELDIDVPQLGYCTPSDLLYLFNQVEFVADFSIFEGLGLVCLEGAFCGAIPIFTKKGGLDSVFEHGKNAIIIDSHADFFPVFEQLEKLSDTDKDDIRNNLSQIPKSRNFEAAFSSLLEYLKKDARHIDLATSPRYHRALIEPSSPLYASYMDQLALFSDISAYPLTHIKELALPTANPPRHFIDNIIVTKDVIHVVGWGIERETKTFPRFIVLLIDDMIAFVTTPEVQRPDVQRIHDLDSDAVGFNIQLSKELLIHFLSIYKPFQENIDWTWEKKAISVAYIFDDSLWQSAPLYNASFPHTPLNIIWQRTPKQISDFTPMIRYNYLQSIYTFKQLPKQHHPLVGIKQHIDTVEIDDSSLYIKGWIFGKHGVPEVALLFVNSRLVASSTISTPRQDIMKHYQISPTLSKCEFQLQLDINDDSGKTPPEVKELLSTQPLDSQRITLLFPFLRGWHEIVIQPSS